MIHRHRALGQRVNRVFLQINVIILKRRIPDRQRVHRGFDPFAQMIGGLVLAVPFSRQLKMTHGFNIKIKDIGLRAVKNAHLNGPVLIVHIPRLHIRGLLWNVLNKEPTIGDIALDLAAIWRTAAMGQPSLAQPPARKWPNPRLAFVVGDIVGVIVEFCAAIFVGETR